MKKAHKTKKTNFLIKFLKKWGILVVVAIGVVSVLPYLFPRSKVLPAKAGFDEFGYNRTARIFNGTGLSWCLGKFGWTEAECRAYLETSADDKLVMKWNDEWDRGNAEGWSVEKGPYNAWLDNQWNGMKEGSRSVWHYKIVWIGPCGADYTDLPGGGYCLWGQFKVLADQGKDITGHFWFTHANPTGYGAY